MYQKTEKTNIKKEDAQKILGDELYFDVLEIESSTLLDKFLFGFFERCFSINQVITKYGFSLRFFERRNPNRFLLKKKGKRKNDVTRNLSTCVLKNLDDYETLRKNLERKESLNFAPIDSQVLSSMCQLFVIFPLKFTWVIGAT